MSIVDPKVDHELLQTLVVQCGLNSCNDQQWIVFSLLISTHKILKLSESRTLKFNNVLWFIYTHYNVDFVTTGCNEYVYNFDIKLITNHKHS